MGSQTIGADKSANKQHRPPPRTGNYNADTARLYCDIGLLTCTKDIGADLTELFNYLTTSPSASTPRSSRPKRYLLSRIEQAAKSPQKGRKQPCLPHCIN